MKEWLRKVIFSVSILAFIGSSILLIKFLLIDPNVSKKAAEEAQGLYYSIDDSGGNNMEEKFSNLIKINPDIKAWIKIDNTVIDYPVVQSDNPTYYLNYNYKKEASRYGSIFIDSLCKDGVNSKNIILHGHHMRDGQMFAALMKFSDLEFYKSTPTITFSTPTDSTKWKIISIFKTNTREDQGKVFNYLAYSFMNNESFLNYVHNVRLRSLIDIDVDTKETDQLMTLSTCSYEFDDFRTVVVARKVRPNESESVNVNNASVASNPLMPDCWYKKHGGNPPAYSDFQSDFKSGKISWYAS